MAGLEQYAIPHDPQAEHQLHWTPGNHGKGLITPEGIVHHWNVDQVDGQPQHRRYVMESPGLGFDPYPDEHWRDKLAPFWIHPDGTMSMIWTSQDPDRALKADPRLSPPRPEDQWKFADFRNQERALDPGPPKIVSEYPDSSPEAIEYNTDHARRPFIYHGMTNTVYVGAPAAHHQDVIKQYGLHLTPTEMVEQETPQYEGYIMKGYPKFEDESAYPDEAAWFHRAPDNHLEVLDAIAAHHGVPPSHFDPDAGWRFAFAPVAPTVPTCNHCGSTHLSPPREIGYKLVQTCENCGRTQLTGGTKLADTTDDIMRMLTPLIPPPMKPDPEHEERMRQKAADPIKFERENDWDRPGDVQRGRPDIEWVPTHELKKFIEFDRRPGGKDAWSNQERWDQLGQHIKTQGFKNPVWLDFNPDTGMAYMSEGNHRTQIALDHGIPAVPVSVYRSQRKSPTQIPVNPQPLAEWEDQFDPTGYHYPQYMKPSHIGLPTVPPPEQRTSDWKDYRSDGKWAWIEGLPARFWRDSEYGDADEDDYENAMRQEGLNTKQRRDAWENGSVADFDLQPHYDTLLQMARQHPQLAANFQHEIPWSDYDNITQRLDKSGVKWAAGIHGQNGAEVNISGPTVTETDLRPVLNKPVYPFRAWGDPENAYGVEDREWHFGADVQQGVTDPQLGVYGDRPNMAWMNRIPAIYHGGQWYVGQPGTHHADVIKEFGLPRESIKDWGEINLDDGRVESANRNEDQEQELADWATKTLGQQFELEDADWRF